jgi:DNA-binding NarL/FixJ family response regulator
MQTVMIRIVVADSEQKIREKIKSILSPHKDFNVVGTGRDGYDAIKLIPAYKPDIAILGVNLDFINGAEIPPLLKRRSPATSIIILASRLNDHQIYKALSNEVTGLLLEEPDLEHMAFILRKIHAGEYYMNAQISSRIFRIVSGIFRESRRGNSPREPVSSIPSSISKTELQIMHFIGEGNSNKEIAELLNLKAGTVRNYISSAMHKAGLRNRTQMAVYAVENGLTGIVRPARSS